MEPVLTSDQAFHALWPSFCATQHECALLPPQIDELERQLLSLRTQLIQASERQAQIMVQLEVLKPRLVWCPVLPRDVRLSVVGQLAPMVAARAAMVCKEFCRSIALARSLGLFKRSVLAGVGHNFATETGHTVTCVAGKVFTFGSGVQLGHDGANQEEHVPRPIAGLVGRKVVGVAAGDGHTVVCTAEGQMYSFGAGELGQLGHGGEEDELVPRLVEGLVGKKVVGVAAGCTARHSLVWTDHGQVYTFGDGEFGKLGHGGQENELVPRVVVGFDV